MLCNLINPHLNSLRLKHDKVIAVSSTLTLLSEAHITRLGRLLLPFNSQAGLVSLGWGSSNVMVFTMCTFLSFIIIILEVYNKTLLLEEFELDWIDYSPSPLSWIPDLKNE